MGKQEAIVAALLLLSACQPSNWTPLEQPPLETLAASYGGEVFLTLSTPPANARTLVAVAEEFRRQPIRIDVIWQTQNPPATAFLAEFPGKNIRQFHDPRRFTSSTGGKLNVRGVLVPLELLPLRIALARAAAVHSIR